MEVPAQTRPLPEEDREIQHKKNETIWSESLKVGLVERFDIYKHIE